MQDKISIIIPIYNVETYIEKCLNSIINQTYSNIEIILVNDGSADDSGKICDYYKLQDNRIIVVHQCNQGLSMARNIGLEIATGDYIGFIDSDDWVENDMFESLYNYIITHDSDISMCGYYRVNEDNTLISKHPVNFETHPVLIEGKKDIFKYSVLDEEYKIKIDTNQVWNKLFKRFLFNEIRFPKNKLYENLFTMHLLLGKANKIVLAPESKYYYLNRNNSIINQSITIKTFDIIEGAMSRYKYITSLYPELELLCRKGLLNSVLFVLNKIPNIQTIEIYRDQINEMVDIVKKCDIHNLRLPEDELKLLDLFINGSGNRGWFIALKLRSRYQKSNPWHEKHFSKHDYEEA